jgi:hypothetical protein
MTLHRQELYQTAGDQNPTYQAFKLVPSEQSSNLNPFLHLLGRHEGGA